MIKAQLSQVQSVAARTNKEQLSAVVMESQAVSVAFAKELPIVVTVIKKLVHTYFYPFPRPFFSTN